METLLLVEDDVHQANLFKQELEEDGYEVVVAHNGHDALKTFEELEIDLVILDIRMPGMDGIETLGRILGSDNTVPIIIHSAFAHYKDNFLTWAADCYIVKSSDLYELKTKIRETLGKGRKMA